MPKLILRLIIVSLSILWWGCLFDNDDTSSDEDTFDSTAYLDSIAREDSIAMADSIAQADSIALADSIAMADSIARADSIAAYIADSINIYLADSVAAYIADSIANSIIIINQGDDSTGGDTVKVEDPFAIDITDNSTIDSSGDGFIIMNETTNDCENGVLITTQETDTMFYQIDNGSLLTWQEGDCSKIIYEGTSTSIEGEWNTTYETIEITDLVTCSDDDNIQNMLPYLVNPTGTATITENSIDYTIDADVCMAPWMAENLRDGGGIFGDDDEDTSTVISDIMVDGCTDLSYTTSFGEIDSIPMVIKITEKDDDELNLGVTMGNCTILQTMPKFETTAENCNNDGPGFEDSSFQNCLMTWIFDNMCFVDMIISGAEEDTSNNLEYTKIDCNRLEAVLATNDTDTLLLEVEYNFENDLMMATTTIGACNFTGSLDENAFEDSVFSACAEEEFAAIGGGTPYPSLKKKSAGYPQVLPGIRKYLPESL